MSSVLEAALLGVLQGLTEFLPVSSTAHLLIAERLLGFRDPGSVFTEMIQLGSILAVMWLYRAKIAGVIAGLRTRPESRRLAMAVGLAFLPAAITGLVAADYVESVLHQSPTVIATAFIAGGIVMLLVDRLAAQPVVTRLDDVPAGRALGVGLAQILALVPGVSRSGSTIVGGLFAGLDRPTAAEFSFFLAMPTMLAAFAHSLLELRHQITVDRAGDLSVGFVMAFLASALVVRPFLSFIRKAGFAPFAWYRIVAGLAIFAAAAAGLL